MSTFKYIEKKILVIIIFCDNMRFSRWNIFINKEYHKNKKTNFNNK